MVLLPMLFALYAAFFRWGGFGMPSDYVGTDNFTQLFDNPVFLGDLWRCLVLVVLSLAFQLPFALAMAVLLNQKLRGRAVYRMLFFAPYVLSEAITGVLFSMVFAPDSGLADHIFGAVGLDGVGGLWFADPSYVMATLFLVMMWKYFGFHMMLYLAGLQSIPRELTEAALIDGAGCLATVPQRHPAAARAHPADQHLPVRDRFDPALRPGVGGHPGRPRPPLRDHGRDHVPVRVQALPGRLRQRDQRGHVRHLPRLRPRLPAVRAPPRPRRGHHDDEGDGK